MAKITIFEKDVTTANSSSTTANVVYVPGYAIMGPENTPTLCNSLDEFYSIFGRTPYRFKSLQTINNTTTLAIQNDYEKSFIYAAELLKSGLPVLYERVVDANLPAATSTINLYEKSYVYTQEQTQATTTISLDKTNESLPYIYKYTNENFTNTQYGIEEETLKVILGGVEFTYGDTASSIVTLKDESNTISSDNLTVTYNITEGSIIVSELTEGYLEANLIDLTKVNVVYDLKNPTSWAVQGKYVDGVIDWKLYHQNVNGDIIDTQAEITFTAPSHIKVTTPSNLTIDADATIEVSDSKSNSSIKINALYKGEYGKNISYKIEPHKATNYYRIEVKFGDEIDSLVVSLDENNEDYILNKQFKFVNFEGTTLDNNLIKANMYYLPNNQLDGNLSYIPSSTSSVEEFTYASMYAKFNTGNFFDKLTDKGEYNVKLITSGAYPVYSHSDTSETKHVIVNNMLMSAATRGDAIALIDAFDANPLDIYEKIQSLPVSYTSVTAEDIRKYGTMVLPSAKYQMQTINKTMDMPGSFAYLKCLASSSKVSSNWYAVSGVTRGLIPNFIKPNQNMTGAIANKLQEKEGISINPITNINPYGYCIWGNRTLNNNITGLTASSFLNIRMLSNDVKKVVYTAARKLTFELNSDMLWLNFKSEIEPTLDSMVNGNGLSDYKIIRVNPTSRSTVSCKIKLYAIEAVEDWEITIELADNYISVS